MRRAVLLFALVAGGCSAWRTSGPSGPDPEPFFAAERLPWDEGAWLRAIEGRVGTDELGPATTIATYRWRPRAGEEIWLLVACRGAGGARACSVGAARGGMQPDAGRYIEVMGVESVGWARPQVGGTADRAELVIAGEDGRGNWRQAVHFVADGRAARFGRRVYVDGM